MNQLTPAVKRKITLDWNRCFPELGIHKPLHLLRRVGPLLIGILLERDSTPDRYLPTFHVHNLAKPFPVITLTLSEPLRTEITQAPDQIKVSQHESRFEKASERMSRQALLPLKGDVRLNEVIRAYQAYFERPTTHYQIELFEDMILISAWCQDRERVAKLLSEAESVPITWPKNRLEEIGGFNESVSYGRCLKHPHSSRERLMRK